MLMFHHINRVVDTAYFHEEKKFSRGTSLAEAFMTKKKVMGCRETGTIRDTTETKLSTL